MWLAVPGVAADELAGGASLPQHRAAGIQVLSEVSTQDRVQEAVRQTEEPLGADHQAGEAVMTN